MARGQQGGQSGPDPADLADEFEPVHLGHRIIDDQQVDRHVAGEPSQRFHRAHRLLDTISGVAQEAAHEAAHFRIVVADQDMLATPGALAGPARRRTLSMPRTG
jgi:hypothetical protein